MNSNFYERVYKNYSLLNKNPNQGLIKDLSISVQMLVHFEKMGIIIMNKDNYCFIDENEKKIHKVDLYFYCNNYHKLDKILHPNNKTKFLIHFIIFNINSYLTIDNLIKKIRSLIKIEINEEDIINAHNVLLDAGLICKQFCNNNTYHDDGDMIIIIKDSWFFNNESVKRYFEHEIPVDYLQKIILSKFVRSL